MKLMSITWSTTPRLPGLRATDTGRIDCDKPAEALKGWKVHIRGSQIWFVSPNGWNRDQSIRTRNPEGPRTVFGPIPTTEVYLEWLAENEADITTLLKGKMLEFESPVFGWMPAPLPADKPFLEPIPAGQMGDA